MTTKDENESAKMSKKSEHERAQAQVQSNIDLSRPKNLGAGVASGVGNIFAGAVGAVGLIVLVPTVTMAAGAKQAGVLGGVIGLTQGVVVGALGGALALGGGIFTGLVKLIRGVESIPSSIAAPMSGKWWNETEHTWVETNLEVEAELMKKIPKEDMDILGEALNDVEAPSAEKDTKEIKETFYYDVLEVDPDADRSKIKRQYYVLARKYHPDKVGTDNKEAADKFKDIAEAYQVLSDEDLRKVYDESGREGLSPDKTNIAEGTPQIDPSLLFAFLFGSDLFGHYVGRLAMATSAMTGDSQKITPKDARIIQKRRCTRLAFSLAERLTTWVQGDVDTATKLWEVEAQELSKASYGSELVHLIGQVYSIAATVFLGAFDSGIGMPSLSKWTSTHGARMKQKNANNKATMNTVKGAMDMANLQRLAQKKLKEATTDEEKAAIYKQLEEDNLAMLLQIMWTITTVDITSTLHETCQMVFFDKSVDKKDRKKRGEGVLKLGEIFMACPTVDGDNKGAKHMYEEAAFAAMLDTIKRKENASFNAGMQ